MKVAVNKRHNPEIMDQAPDHPGIAEHTCDQTYLPKENASWNKEGRDLESECPKLCFNVSKHQ